MKMIVAEWYKVPIVVSLAVIAMVLLASVIVSIIWPRHVELEVESDALEDLRHESAGRPDSGADGLR